MKTVTRVLSLLLVLGGATLLAPAQQQSSWTLRQQAVEHQPVTFNRDVVRILQNRCQTCHHAGDIAPFPLVTYQDTYKHRQAIRYNTENRIMPPWHAGPSCAEFQDNPSLTAEEIQTLATWVATGAPEGNPADMPPALQFSSGWPLGEPDLVFTMPQPVTPDFSNGDVYRCFVFPTNLDQDLFLGAVDIAPGSRKMVHHVLLYVDQTTKSEELDAGEPGPGYTCFGGPGFDFVWSLGGWAPGNSAKLLPDGIGLYLPKNSRIVMQVHYSARSGITEPDRTSIGLYRSQKPVQKRLLNLPVINQSFKIPPGESNYKVTANVPFVPLGVQLIGITPHMHLLGEKMKVTARINGKEVCLIDVPDWDFHHQRTYLYKEQIAMPFGSRVDLTAYYDNSAANPNQPNQPPKEVGWGENTTDEMCIAFLHFTLDAENLTGSFGQAATTIHSFEPFWEVNLLPVPRQPGPIKGPIRPHRH